MAFARHMMAGGIVKEALALQGLPVPTSVVANARDVTARQMWAQLRTWGRRLCKPTRTHRWQALKREWQLPTVAGQTLYELPVDFDSLIDQTSWNTSSSFPMVGPATDSQWQTMVGRSSASTTFAMLYRIIGDKLELSSSPGDSQQLSLLYNSRAWVRLENSPPDNPLYADAPVSDGDTIMFDPELMVAAVQYGFMAAKGFDTTSIAQQFERMLEAAIDADEDAPTLSLAPSSNSGLISQCNVPDTGYGG